MQKIEIKVNVINEMMKLKNNAYADRLAWVEELVQNSQRAKAKNVRMRADASDDTSVSSAAVSWTEP